MKEDGKYISPEESHIQLCISWGFEEESLSFIKHGYYQAQNTTLGVMR